MGTADNLPILDDTHYRVYKLSNDSYSNSPEDVMTGLCGGGRGNTNQNYTIDLANNNLTILGSGTMKDYSSDSPAPWQEYSQYIEYVDIAPSAQIDAEAFDGSVPQTAAIETRDRRFYRAEIFDLTHGYPVAIGNPIWLDGKRI